ncbi:hypothetical protein D0T53_02900 [Dysgonomonas sp. 216]|uniref:LIC_10190 family membrane protein n=1 Tax=Dysgonomonas sp. 216 TaxID=2302934 RepID=UPI0013D67BE3|nr:hypothetical protein [Dysgonomonas sp. 216]NDW17865.1 hypothetical protein [Dysgonomonas sp. 216]
MLAVFVSWIICTFISLNIGRMFIRLFNIGKQLYSYNVADTFFIGISITTSLLTFASIWLPLNSFVFGGLFFLSACFFLYNIYKGDFKQLIALKSKIGSLSIIYKIILAVIVLFLACFVLLPPLAYDTGLYHLQALMWLEDYSVIPGLGNIHERLGFNSNALIIHSIFSAQDIFGLRVYGVQSLCLIVLLCWMTYRASKSSILHQIALLCIGVFTIACYSGFLSSPSTDVLPNVFVLYVLLRLLFDTDSVNKLPLLYWVVPIFSLTLKLSVTPICIVCIVVLYFLYKEKQYKSIVFLLLLSCFIVIPWCIRNIIITGYLIYPFPAIDIFNFDWKIPIKMVEAEKAWVTSWARFPNLHYEEVFEMPFWVWGKSWLLRHIWFFRMNLFATGMAGISPFIMLYSFKKNLLENSKIIYVWSIAIIGVLFWLIMAPDARFGFGFIVATAFIPFLGLKSGLKLNKYKFVAPLVFVLYIVYASISLYKDINEYKGERTSLTLCINLKVLTR